MSERTPGPWELWSDSTGAFQISKGSVVICSRNQIAHRAEESRANAHLIAAAPTMLAAAKGLDRFLLVIESAVRNSDPSQHREVLTALIANRDAIHAAVGPMTSTLETKP